MMFFIFYYDTLNTENVFTGIFLLSMLVAPMNMFPYIIACVAKMKNSYRRIMLFFTFNEVDEKSDEYVEESTDPSRDFGINENAIEIKNFDFKYPAEDK
jgi:ABC-type multidrug transport system fused ATPase/permease subunit